MDHFLRKGTALYAEDVPLADIADAVGTPCYVYSRATLERHWRAFDDALSGLDHMVCYAVKANSNLAVLGVLASLGSGFDIVSVGELERVLAAGGAAERVRGARAAGVAWLRVCAARVLAHGSNAAAAPRCAPVRSWRACAVRLPLALRTARQ